MKQIVIPLIILHLINFSCGGQENISKEQKVNLLEIPEIEMSEVGINKDSIQNLFNIISSLKNPPATDLRGIVVIKNDHLAIEKYFNTYWRATIHDIRSAGKSVTSLLLGIAIDKGLIKGVDQKLDVFFPKHKSEILSEISIHDLLIMSSGLDADTFDPNSKGNSLNWISKENWLEHILDLEKKFEPGEKWVYNDASALLIGAIIEEQSGQKLVDFANKHLFTPLGIKEYYWFSGQGNRTGAMGNLYISTLDFAKIGYLVLNEGKWDNNQIISSNWINEISKPRLNIENVTPFAKQYGYFWYISNFNSNNSTVEYIYAAGNGGNLLFVVPSKELVVSITSSAYGLGYGQNRSNNIFKFIVNALEN